MSRIRWQEPNLARSPFVNERPVRRLAITLWVLFALVAGLGVWQSRASRRETSDRLAELVRLNGETVAARDRAAALEKELRSADLPAQNERTAFLNRRLAERSFSWSRLLESLTAVMPRGVRLIRLSPESFVSERRRGVANPRTAATTRVALRISGEAEETEALLEFVDRLFQQPAFDRPNLARESEKKDSRIQFELAVGYLPEVAAQPADAATPTAAAAVAAPSGPLAGGAAGASPAASGAAATAATASGPASPPTTTGKTAPAGPAVAGRQPPRAGATGAPSAWGDGGGAGADGKAGAETRGPEEAPVPAGGGRFSGVPAGAVPPMGAAGGGFRPAGATPPAAAPPAGGGQFPNNVMPTPLRPYASSTGGGR